MRTYTAAKLLPGLLLWLSAPVFADSVVVGNGTPGSCTDAALDAAIGVLYPGAQAPGGELSFNCGPNPLTIALTAQKLLREGTTVNGGGKITLDGQNLTRIFEIVDAGAQVGLANIDLIRGRAVGGYGGAVLVNTGTLVTLTNVKVLDSRADLTGGAIAVAPGAGLNIAASRFERNRARDGGAIATSSDTLIDSSVFFNNDAEFDQGGAIQSWFSTLTISNSSFVFNAALNGGAILQRAGSAQVSSSAFSDNQSRDRGGAYHVYEGGVATVTASQFTQNSAATDGGAVYVAGVTLPSGGVVVSSTFQASGSDFDGNQALRAGGGLYNYGVNPLDEGLIGALRLANCRVRNNQAVSGGGIYTQGVFESHDLLVSANTATLGGGFYLAPINDISFSSVAKFKLERSSISGNSASQRGGGLLITETVPQFAGMQINDNRAQDGAGVAFVGTSVSAVRQSSLARNIASRFGGGVYIDSAFGVVIDFATFSANQATGGGGRGGDVYIASLAPGGGTSQLILSNSTLIDGLANQGSTLYADVNTSVRIEKSIIWPFLGGACQAAGNAALSSTGGNVLIVAGCPIDPMTDITVASFAALGLNPLTGFNDGSQGYLPAAGSITLDRLTCNPGADQRGLPRPIDIDGDGFVLCDAGALERQLVEATGLFANGFE